MEQQSRTTTALGEVVRAQHEATGKSYRTIASEAGISINTVHKILHGKLTHIPGARVLDGLARALGVDVTVLRDAAAHDVGLREFVVEDSTRRAVYLAMGDLDPADQQTILRMAETLRNVAQAKSDIRRDD